PFRDRLQLLIRGSDNPLFSEVSRLNVLESSNIRTVVSLVKFVRENLPFHGFSSAQAGFVVKHATSSYDVPAEICLHFVRTGNTQFATSLRIAKFAQCTGEIFYVIEPVRQPVPIYAICYSERMVGNAW